MLLWNGAEWLPGDVASTSTTFSVRVEETVTAASGEATFTDLGGYGVLYEIQADADAWVVLYSTAAERTADAARTVATSLSQWFAVLMQFLLYVMAVRISPSTNYFNADLAATSAIYAAIRDSDVRLDRQLLAVSGQGLRARGLRLGLWRHFRFGLIGSLGGVSGAHG